jgi:hypothetical protein
MYSETIMKTRINRHNSATTTQQKKLSKNRSKQTNTKRELFSFYLLILFAPAFAIDPKTIFPLHRTLSRPSIYISLVDPNNKIKSPK